jgi:hypothetical protein
MGRPRLNRTEEETKRLRHEYYLEHKTEILEKAKERKLHPSRPKKKVKTEIAYQSLINEWIEQLTIKLQENLPQWLKIAIQDQITINKAMLINQYEKENNSLLLST